MSLSSKLIKPKLGAVMDTSVLYLISRKHKWQPEFVIWRERRSFRTKPFLGDQSLPPGKGCRIWINNNGVGGKHTLEVVSELEPWSQPLLLPWACGWLHYVLFMSSSSKDLSVLVGWIVSSSKDRKSSPPVPVNVTLFGNTVFTDVIKFRSDHTEQEWALIQWLVSSEDGNLDTEKYREENIV